MPHQKLLKPELCTENRRTMPQTNSITPNIPGIFPEIDIDKIPSIRDIGKKSERDEQKQPPKSPCPYCGGFH